MEEILEYTRLLKKVQRLQDENNFLRKNNRLLTRTENDMEDMINKKIVKYDYEKIHHNYTNRALRSEFGTCLFLSDLHINKIVKQTSVLTNEYNINIMQKRIQKVIENLVDYKYKSQNIDIFLGGDILDGIIHNGHITGELSVPESLEVMYNVLSNIIDISRKNYKVIRIHAVMGNHSRITEKVEYSNRKHQDFETIVYNMISRDIKKFNNVSLNVSDTGYILQNINGKNVFMMHGDQDRNFQSNMASASKLQQKCMTMFGKTFNHVLVGHFHIPKITDSGFSGKIIQNSSMIGTDEYAFQNPFSLARPSQSIFFINEDGDIENIHQFYTENV